MKINPETLQITDLRFADIDGAPKRCTLLKLYTNQGIVGDVATLNAIGECSVAPLSGLL